MAGEPSIRERIPYVRGRQRLLQSYARNRSTLIQSWFRRTARCAFWKLGCLIKNILYRTNARRRCGGRPGPNMDEPDPMKRYFGTAIPTNIPDLYFFVPLRPWRFFNPYTVPGVYSMVAAPSQRSVCADGGERDR